MKAVAERRGPANVAATLYEETPESLTARGAAHARAAALPPAGSRPSACGPQSKRAVGSTPCAAHSGARDERWGPPKRGLRIWGREQAITRDNERPCFVPLRRARDCAPDLTSSRGGREDRRCPRSGGGAAALVRGLRQGADQVPRRTNRLSGLLARRDAHGLRLSEGGARSCARDVPQQVSAPEAVRHAYQWLVVRLEAIDKEELCELVFEPGRCRPPSPGSNRDPKKRMGAPHFATRALGRHVWASGASRSSGGARGSCCGRRIRTSWRRRSRPVRVALGSRRSRDHSRGRGSSG